MPKIGRRVFVAAIGSVTHGGDDVAVSVAQLGRSLRPGGIQEAWFFPRGTLIGTVVEVLPRSAFSDERAGCSGWYELLCDRRNRAAGKARVGAVERVVDRSVRRVHHQIMTRRDLAAVLPEGRGLDTRVKWRGRAVAQCRVAELVEDDAGSGREVVVDDPIDRRLPVRFGVRRRSFRVTPAGRFGDDRHLDLARPFEQPFRVRFRRNQPLVEETLMDAVGELQPVFGMGHQLLVKPLRVAVLEGVAGRPRPVAVHVQVAFEQRVLGVVGEEQEPPVAGSVADSVPVVRPVVAEEV